MSEQIYVEPKKLEEAGKSVQDCAGRYKKIADTLMESASQMEAWKGDDNLAFVAQIKGFTEELEQMHKKLDLVGKTMEQQATNYKNRQQANIDGVKQLKN